MKFSKILAYDLNPLSLQRLQQDELYDIKDILVVESGEIAIIRFSDIQYIANKYDYSIQEAGQLISQNHGKQEFVAVINETKFYFNEDYRYDVINNKKTIPMQWVSAGTNIELDNLLEECIERDLQEGTLENSDMILNEFLNNAFAGTTDATRALGNDITQTGSFLGNLIDKGTNKVLNFAGDKLGGMGLNFLNKSEYSEKAATALGNFAQKTIDKVGGATKDAFAPYVKGAAAATTIGALINMVGNQVNNLTNQENMGTNDPNKVAQTINSLKSQLDTLVGRQASAPPQQQGMIAALIQKIKNAIKTLGQKVGLVNNAPQS